MQPLDVQVRSEVWPLKEAFTISRGSKTAAHVVVASVTDGRFAGRGEAVPYARYGESVEGVVQQIRDAAPNVTTRAALAQNVVDPSFVTALPDCERVTWRIDRNAQTVQLEEPPEGLRYLVLPLEPMIGCFGVAPGGGQAISTTTSAEHVAITRSIHTVESIAERTVNVEINHSVAGIITEISCEIAEGVVEHARVL